MEWWTLLGRKEDVGDYWRRYDLSKNADFDGSWNIGNKYFEYAKKSNKSFSWSNYQKLFISLKFYIISGFSTVCFPPSPFIHFFACSKNRIFSLLRKKAFWSKYECQSHLKSFEKQFSSKNENFKKWEKTVDLSCKK